MMLRVRPLPLRPRSGRAPLSGAVSVPGDKSVTHRALILAAIAEGDTVVQGWVPAEVCLATRRCMEALGVEIEEQPPALLIHGHGLDGLRAANPCSADFSPHLLIHGHGLDGLREPGDVLHCAGSGTTMRLLAGLLAGQGFTSLLTGSGPLLRRPMDRIAEPLRAMGAVVLGRDGGRLPPLAIRGGRLSGIDYRLPMASAQVKSAILIAALYAAGETVIHEPGPSRDHTERMLRWFGAPVEREGGRIRTQGGRRLMAPAGAPLVVPADLSSAAFPLVAAAIVPGSQVVVRDVGVNPTRDGILDLLAEMGAEVNVEPVLSEDHAGISGEPIASITVRGSDLSAVEVGGATVVRAIDELPIFAVAATQAAGATVVREAGELRVKESDRIACVVAELRKMGADILEQGDGMVVRGPTRLRGASVDCHRDHRLAMALAVAGLVADGETCVHGAEAIDDSFPGFAKVMSALGADMSWEGYPCSAGLSPYVREEETPGAGA